MHTILILTVGGAHQPILRSIELNRPDFVHFLCSADGGRNKGSYWQVIGEGKVIKSQYALEQPDLPNIAELAGLPPDRFEVHRIEHFDDLNDCYLKAAQVIEKVHVENPSAMVLADYTGGTKSMTAGLAAAALDDGQCEIRLVAGLRQNLERVTNQTEFVRPIQVWDVQANRRMHAASELIQRFDYASAVRILEDVAARFASDATIEQLQRWLALCRAFDAWDRFNHGTAHQLLQSYRGVVDTHKTFLALVMGGRGHGFELIEDLLLNADRRAAQGRYDDAVGRLYRSVELTAQIWLEKRYGLATGGMDVAAVPNSMKPRLEERRDEKGKVRIGLLLAWDVIAAFADDPLGVCFTEYRTKLLSFLEVRNQSLFAHGIRPVVQQDYRMHAPQVAGFVRDAIGHALEVLGKRRIVELAQFPTQWE